MTPLRVLVKCNGEEDQTPASGGARGRQRTGAMLKTPDEVKAWLANTETSLLAKLRNGPVVIN
jgi:hypothetical protein